MRAFLFVAVLFVLSAGACPPVFSGVSVIFNKKGVVLDKPPKNRIEKMRRKLGLESIEIDERTPSISVTAPHEEKVLEISSSVDLRPWFKKPECGHNWESFDRCLQKGLNREDESLYRHLDREFYSKVICQENGLDPEMDRDLLPQGSQRARSAKELAASCLDPNLPKWELRWPRPWYFTLRTKGIGKEGGFASAQEAQKSLHRINRLLSRVLPKARFPENPSENSDMNVYARITRPVYHHDVGPGLMSLLRIMSEEGFLKGLTSMDLEAINRLAKGGRSIYYLPPECPKEGAIPECFRVQERGSGYLKNMCVERKEKMQPGWHATSNGNRLTIGPEGCPVVEALR